MVALVTVREYETLGKDANGQSVPVGQEPALVATAITPTGVSAQHTFNTKTRFAEIYTEEIVNFAMTADGSPTAVTGGAGKLAAGTRLFIGVNKSATDPQKIAFIVDS